MIQRMNTTSTSNDFAAGRPRRSLPIRAIARPVGPIGNRLAGHRFFPLWGILRHTGRTSRKAYSTPVVVFSTADGFIVPLPFGDATQWAKNLFAAGGGSIRHAGREYRVVEPQIVDREAVADQFPRLIRIITRQIGLRQFVTVRRVEA
jgi:deazaflavin-dependent oxidoreductase (nitroreductase family)